MAILVVCPGCTSRFTVSDQFAGRTGPCPKCKKPITVPRPEAQAVTIHEPAPAGAGTGGKSFTVPFKSLDRPVAPLAFVAGGIGAVLLLLAAWLYRWAAGEPPPAWIALTVAFLVGIPCAAIGYAALRNRELEAYTGSALLLRCLGCATVYAALWAVRTIFLGPEATQYMWQWLYIAPVFLLPGALAALVAFDLDWGEAAAHFSFYVVFTALLRWLSGISRRSDALPMPIASLPELVALDVASSGVRIPPGVTVPLTPRVRALLDSAEVRRLARVSQLGLVGLVYPGAVHTRLEHSLGVYRLALEFLARLSRDERFAAVVGESDAAAFVAAALLHDVGHWPYCHPIEDMGLPEIPRHESLVRGILAAGDTGRILDATWGLDPARVAALIEGTAADPAGRILVSLLSGPVDVDKMDYLARDSLHAGVPYGRNFDQDRLLASLCLDESGTALAITDKGRTAAELLVFARYVMFSEVYWHHAVRAATAMLQRAVWLVRDRLDVPRIVRADDTAWTALLASAAAGTPAEPLVAGLFGPRRHLFKRVAAWDAAHSPALHRALAGRPYAAMTAVSARLADLMSSRIGRHLAADALLVDAPPAAKEVEFRLQVRDRPDGPDGGTRPTWRRLEDVSPVVRSLAREQFDDLVKRVRIFAAPDVAGAAAACDGLEDLVLEASAG